MDGHRQNHLSAFDGRENMTSLSIKIRFLFLVLRSTMKVHNSVAATNGFLAIRFILIIYRNLSLAFLPPVA